MRSALLTLLLLALAASPAAAATVEVRLTRFHWQAEYRAAPGERSDLAITRVDADTLRFADASAPLTAGEGCRLLDPRTAECATDPNLPIGPPRTLPITQVELGDLDDAVRVGPGIVARLDGGPGDDLLESGDGNDTLEGGGGRDRLYGRGGEDSLSDGDAPGSADRDVLDGGAGRSNTVDYAHRTDDLVLDLAEPADSEDDLTGIFGVRGGSGDDDIGGNGATNTLEGGPGDDHLDGEGGDDGLLGGAGDDRLHGHGGDDDVRGGTGRDELGGGADRDLFAVDALDLVRCGSGVDGMGDVRGTRVGADCERISYSYDAETGSLEGEDEFAVGPSPRITRRGLLRFTVGCRSPAGSGGACSPTHGTIVVRRAPAGPVLGRGRIARPLAEGPDDVVATVRLGSRGRRMLARRRGFLARVEVAGEALPRVSWTIRLRR